MRELRPTGPNAIVLRPGEGRNIDLGNFTMTVKADSAQSAGAFSILEAAEPPGFGPPLHIHHNTGESFFVLEGEYRIFVEDEAYDCPAGSFIYVPAGLRHGFRVADRPSRKLNIYTPGAMVAYFDQLAAAIASGGADVDSLGDIARKSGMEVLGPVPEGYL